LLKAIDENNKRISPEKGRIGFCQLCKKKVRAYCGEINIDHWRHIKIQNCDSWSEGETEWHREWKKEFPDDWQEVIIEKDSEIHIADILTSSNLVLELQNSSISSTTIKIREKFYGKMIWLINANKFKDNFSISSVVKTQLRHLDDNYRDFLNYEPSESYELTTAKEELEDFENKLYNIDYKISNLKNKLNDLDEFLGDFKETSEKFISSNYYNSRIMYDLEILEQKELKEINNIRAQLKDELEAKKKLLRIIDSLESCKIDNYLNYKFIEPNQISSSSFEKCALIEKETETSLFPTIIKFKSKIEFERTAKNQKYRLIVNPISKIEKTNEEIADLENKIEKLKEKKAETKKKIKKQLKSFLKKKRKKIKHKLKLKETKKAKIKTALSLKEEDIESIKNIDSQNRAREYNSITESHEKERFKVMKRYKGLYNYYWKYKRKSWDYSEKKIYLDFENAIFEILSNNTLRKHSKSDFIKIVKNWC
tara:strand:- start:82 stop:1527 length:1446 start_codon:yes stop_codon:yes gene_type:complete